MRPPDLVSLTALDGVSDRRAEALVATVVDRHLLPVAAPDGRFCSWCSRLTEAERTRRFLQSMSE